jgi:hypothetical protein
MRRLLGSFEPDAHAPPKSSSSPAAAATRIAGAWRQRRSTDGQRRQTQLQIHAAAAVGVHDERVLYFNMDVSQVAVARCAMPRGEIAQGGCKTPKNRSQQQSEL